MKIHSALGWTILALAGCRGEEITRVHLQAAGDSGEATWTVSGTKKAKVWANFNGKWKGGKDPGAKYKVELKQGDKSLSTSTCSTRDGGSRVCSSVTSVNGDSSGDCEGATSCTLEAPSDGTYTVVATVENAGGFYEPKDMSIILRK